MKSIAAVAILLAFTLPFALAANPHAASTSTLTERLIESSIEALREGTAEQRAAAAKALIPLGPKAARAVPSLILAFEEFPGPTVGRPVAEALAAIGPAARAALPALIKVVSITTADQFLLHDVSTAIVALGDPANPAMIRTALSFQIGRSKAPETLDL